MRIRLWEGFQMRRRRRGRKLSRGKGAAHACNCESTAHEKIERVAAWIGVPIGRG